MAKDLRFPNINWLTISGRLTRDIELRYTSKGTPVAPIAIATNRRYRDAGGEWHEETSFFDVVIIGDRAEYYAQNLHKGSAVIVEGDLRSRSYQTKDGQNRKSVEIFANRIHLLEWDERSSDGHRVDSRYDDFDNGHQEPAEQGASTEDSTPIQDDAVPF